MDERDIVESLSEMKTEVKDGIVFAFFEGTWMGVVNSEVWQIMKNYNIYLRVNKDPRALANGSNTFVLVCNDQEVFLSRSKSELLRHKLAKGDQFGYIGVLGIDPDDPSIFTCLVVGAVLKLGATQKPAGFDDSQ